MKGFTYFEILLSLLLLSFTLESSKTIYQQLKYTNYLQHEEEDLFQLQAKLDRLQIEQILHKNFSENCVLINSIRTTNYNFYDCQLENNTIILWKKIN